jgi:hypothetical protein
MRYSLEVWLTCHDVCQPLGVSDPGLDSAFQRGCGSRIPVSDEGEEGGILSDLGKDMPRLAKTVMGESRLLAIPGALFREVAVALPPSV